MVLDVYKFREHILLRHKRIPDTCRRVYESHRTNECYGLRSIYDTFTNSMT